MIIFGDGSQTRDFTYVSDTARGILQAGLYDAAVGHTVNIGQGQEISINALAAQVGSSLGLKNPNIVHEAPRPGDVLRLYADTTKARHLFGYSPLLGMEEGLSRLRDWYQHSGLTPEQLLSEERIRNWESSEILWSA
jgi:UDP-glucose 4-epimerase